MQDHHNRSIWKLINNVTINKITFFWYSNFCINVEFSSTNSYLRYDIISALWFFFWHCCFCRLVYFFFLLRSWSFLYRPLSFLAKMRKKNIPRALENKSSRFAVSTAIKIGKIPRNYGNRRELVHFHGFPIGNSDLFRVFWISYLYGAAVAPRFD